MRIFETGATRDQDDTKPDYEGYLSPLVIVAFGRYMTKHRVQADGQLRASDNWQKGIPQDAYIKSMFRHFVDLWLLHRAPSPLTPAGEEAVEEALCAILFNAQGYLHERLKVKQGAVSLAPPPSLEESVRSGNALWAEFIKHNPQHLDVP